MKPKFTMILMLLALGVQMVFAQQKTVSGTVSDENGLPLPGATVLISGTSTGTSTDFDGKYQLTANVGDVLEISYVGYATKSLTNLNLITSNRGASAYAAATKDNILLERRKELMFEGFRFDDMMRTGKDVVVLGSNQNVIETLTYPNDKFVYPIDIAEMDANSNMVQNAGY